MFNKIKIKVRVSPHALATLPDPDRANRRTLNEEGALLYSMIHHAGDIEDLKKFSMHSVINLKPLCLRCNTSKGNSVLG